MMSNQRGLDSKSHLMASWNSWALVGASRYPPGRGLGHLGDVLGSVLGAFWGILAFPQGLLGRFGGMKGVISPHLHPPPAPESKPTLPNRLTQTVR